MPFRTLARAGKEKTRLERHAEVLRKVEKAKEVEKKPSFFEYVFSVIKNRRSVRKYDSKPVSDSMLEKILQAGMHAPSAGNMQPWEFIVVKDYVMRKHIMEASQDQGWMIEAPVYIVLCINMKIASANYGERGEKLYGIQATAAAAQNMLLCAESLSLSTCWVGSFSEARVSILLQLPDYVRPCAIITLGYGQEKPLTPLRQPFEEIVHFERFGNK